MFAPVSRCVASFGVGQRPCPEEDFRAAFGRIFGDVLGSAEDERRSRRKALALFRANAHSQQPAVRAATRVCGFWKLTLFSRFLELFDAKFEKSRRKAPCHKGLRRRSDIKSVCFMPLKSVEVSVAAQILVRLKQR